MSKQSLTQQIQTMLTKYGQEGLNTTIQTLQDKNITPPIQEILTYFIKETWPNTHHPALIALSCEAAGGNPLVDNRIGAAVVMLTGAADLHDDIIDQTTLKTGRQTAYGKYHRDLVLLAGDVLFLKGYFLIQKACETFPVSKQQAIYNSIEQAFNKLASAVTNERILRDKPVDSGAFFAVLEQKGAITQACVEVGAILADADSEQFVALSGFGKTLGYLMTLRNEFSDLNFKTEIENRGKNEILPLPLLMTLEDDVAKKQLEPLLKGKITDKKAQKIAEITQTVAQVTQLKADMLKIKAKEEQNIVKIKKPQALKLLLDYSVSGI
jgi:geranylgeranyl pyrophosphate synthase